MSQQADPVQRVMDGRAWEEFCDTLKAAGAVVLAQSTPNDPLDRAEGYRYLTRLLRAGLETYVEASDSEHPVFQRTTGETVKMGMDSPDNIYLNAPVNGAHDYRICGHAGLRALPRLRLAEGQLRLDRLASDHGLPRSEGHEARPRRELRDHRVQQQAGGRGELAPDGARVAHDPDPPDAARPREGGARAGEDRARRLRVAGEAARSGALRPHAPGCGQDGVRDFETLPEVERGLHEAHEPTAALSARGGVRGRRRPEHRLLPLALGAGARRGAGRRARATRVRLLELPARELVDGVARLPLREDPHQQAHGAVRRGG